jgi:hypothetical protein
MTHGLRCPRCYGPVEPPGALGFYWCQHCELPVEPVRVAVPESEEPEQGELPGLGAAER